MQRVDELSENDPQTTNNDAPPSPPQNLLTVQPKISLLQAMREIAVYAGPYTGSSLIVMGGNFVGVVFVSKLGSDALAASNLASSIQNWFTSTMGATLSAASVIAARKIGSDLPEEVGAVLHQSWFFTWLLSAPCVAVMLASEPILKSLHQNPAIAVLARKFFYGYAWGLPAMFMLSCNRRISLATKNSHIALAFDIFYQCLDTALSYGFIFGEFFLPKLGFAGLGYSNSITAWTTFLLFTSYMACAGRFRPYHLTTFKRERFFSDFLQLIKIGVPIGLKVGAELAFLLVASLMIGALGPNQQAAQEAAFQYIFLISPPMYSLMDGVGTLASKAIGSNNVINAKRYGYSGMMIGVVLYLITLTLFIVIPEKLLNAFVNSREVNSKTILELGKVLMLINGIAQIPDAIRNISSGGLTGFYDTFIPTVLIILTQFLIALPLSYVLGFTVDMEAKGIMLARAISIAVGAGLLLGRFILTDQAKPKAVITTATIQEIKEDEPLVPQEKQQSSLSAGWANFWRRLRPSADKDRIDKLSPQAALA